MTILVTFIHKGFVDDKPLLLSNLVISLFLMVNIVFVKTSLSHVTLFFQGRLIFWSSEVHLNFGNGYSWQKLPPETNSSMLSLYSRK